MSSSALKELEASVFADYLARTPGSAEMFRRAASVLPGGVSGNLRYFKPYPLYMRSGDGAVCEDVDGNRYIDCFLCNGPLLLGHRPPQLADAQVAADQVGSLVLNPAALVDCAERLCAMVPCAKRVRFLNSGTEAVLTAVRYARAFTGRSKIIKFLGHYHGQDDQFLVGAGPTRSAFGHGVPEAAFAHTLTVPFNDIAALERAIEEGSDIAAVLLDPAMHTGGLWGTSRAYLQAVRDLTQRKNIILIFDEVITGFRLSPGGAQVFHGVTPDLATFGKALGAGERLAAVAGRADIMSVVDPAVGNPARRAFQSGTGNDTTRGLAAAAAALDVYRQHGESGEYERLNVRAADLAAGLTASFAKAGIPCHVNQLASMLQLFLTSQKAGFVAYSTLDQTALDLFYLALLTRGVMLSLPTSNHVYLSFAHSDADFARILAVSDEVLAAYPFADAFFEITDQEIVHV